MLVTMLLLLLPFVQLGASYYASVATLMMAIVIMRWLPQIAHGAMQMWPLLLVVLFMPLQLRAAPSIDPTADLLRILREGVMFVILVSAMRGLQMRPSAEGAHAKLLIGLSLFFMAMSLIQMVYFARGAYFGFPEAMYSQLNGTIASEASLFYTADALRPHATFSEPSYLGFVLLSFAVVMAPRLDRSRLAVFTLGVILVVGLISRSLSFLLAFTVLIALPLLFEKRRSRTVLVALIAALGLPLLIYVGPELLHRLYEARSLSTVDSSTSARIVGPLSIIVQYLIDFPAGAPFSVIDRVLTPYIVGQFDSADDILVNAVFNLLFLYGLIGLVMLPIIIFAARGWRMRVYLVCAMMNSGAFLSIDKVAIICLTVALYQSGMRLAGVDDAAPLRQSRRSTTPRQLIYLRSNSQ